MSLLALALWTQQISLSTLLVIRQLRTEPSITNSKWTQLFNRDLLSTCYVAGIVVGIWETAVGKTSDTVLPRRDLLTEMQHTGELRVLAVLRAVGKVKLAPAGRRGQAPP